MTSDRSCGGFATALTEAMRRNYEAAVDKAKKASDEGRQAERDAIVVFLRNGGPCKSGVGGDTFIYGPYQDALEMAADAIVRGEHVGKVEE